MASECMVCKAPHDRKDKATCGKLACVNKYRPSPMDEARREGEEAGFRIGIRTACAFLRANGHGRLADSVACQAPIDGGAPSTGEAGPVAWAVGMKVRTWNGSKVEGEIHALHDNGRIDIKTSDGRIVRWTRETIAHAWEATPAAPQVEGVPTPMDDACCHVADGRMCVLPRYHDVPGRKPAAPPAVQPEPRCTVCGHTKAHLSSSCTGKFEAQQPAVGQGGEPPCRRCGHEKAEHLPPSENEECELLECDCKSYMPPQARNPNRSTIPQPHPSTGRETK